MLLGCSSHEFHQIAAPGFTQVGCHIGSHSISRRPALARFRIWQKLSGNFGFVECVPSRCQQHFVDNLGFGDFGRVRPQPYYVDGLASVPFLFFRAYVKP
jgi:hypothetical protein